MVTVNRSIGMIVMSAVLLYVGLALAEDWPQWRGANRDGKVKAFETPKAWPAALTQKWKANVGLGDATPALVGQQVYVFTRQGDDEVTLCLNAVDGNEVWKDKYAAQAVGGPAGRHPGPRSSPAVADGKVVTLGVGGVVSCLDAAKGTVLWRKDPFPKVVPQFFTSMSPMIVNSMAIAHVGGAGNGAMIAFDLTSGEEKWRWAGEGPAYASPALLTVAETKQVVTLAEKNIVGVNVADGKLLWQVPFAPAGRAYNAATPIVDGQTVIITGAGRGTKALKVEKTNDGFAASEIWSNPNTATQFNTPVLVEGLLFGFSDRGNLFCIDAKDGKTAWTDATKRGQGFASVVAAGSVMLALPENSTLFVFKPVAEAYAEVAQVKIAESPTYAHPVVAGNTVFVKDQDSLAMLTIE